MSAIIGLGCSQPVDSKRRDVRVVEGARLESEACEEHRGTRRDLNAHALSELAA